MCVIFVVYLLPSPILLIFSVPPSLFVTIIIFRYLFNYIFTFPL